MTLGHVIFVLITLLALFIAWRSVTFVNPPYAGLKRAFGNFGSAVYPGPVFVWPWEKLILLPTAWVTLIIKGTAQTKDNVKFKYSAQIMFGLFLNRRSKKPSRETMVNALTWVATAANERLFGTVDSEGKILTGKIDEIVENLANAVVEDIFRGLDSSEATNSATYDAVTAAVKDEVSYLVGQFGIVGKVSFINLESDLLLMKKQTEVEAEAKRAAILTEEEADLEIFEKWQKKYGLKVARERMAARMIERTSKGGSSVNVGLIGNLTNMLGGVLATRLADRNDED